MPGEPDPLYVLARRVLLDALEALGQQRAALILVGAQAIYLHTGSAELAVPEFTTDADIAIDPSLLKAEPQLGAAFAAAGFRRDAQQPGVWVAERSLQGRPAKVLVDLLVPEALGGRPGRRAARLEGHEPQVARNVRGLEAALVDRAPMTITAFEGSDRRNFLVLVAGPAALLVAKLHKVGERAASPRRSEDKDALDVLRLLRAIDLKRLAQGMRRLLVEPLSAEVTREALLFMRDLFAAPRGSGALAAARAAEPLEPADTITASCAALAGDLLRDIDESA